MSQSGQTNFQNLAANDTRPLKCVWAFCNIMHWMVKINLGNLHL